MSSKSRINLKNEFVSGTAATQSKFEDLIDSSYNTNEDSVLLGPIGQTGTRGLVGPTGVTSYYGPFLTSDVPGATTDSGMTGQTVLTDSGAWFCYAEDQWIFVPADSGVINKSLIPDTNLAYDLGSPTKRFNEIYLASNSIYLGEAVLSASPQGDLIVIGASGQTGAIGQTGATGSNGTSGTSGTSGSSGSNGTSGTSGSNGTSGTSGVNGATGPSSNLYYLSAGSTADQNVNGADTETALDIDYVEYSNGWTIAASPNQSRITAGATGTYMIQVEVAISKLNNSVEQATIWLKKNGTNIVASASDFYFSSTSTSTRYIQACNLTHVLQMNSGQYFEVFFEGGTSTFRADASPTRTTPTRPTAPSISVTIVQLS